MFLDSLTLHSPRIILSGDKELPQNRMLCFWKDVDGKEGPAVVSQYSPTSVHPDLALAQAALDALEVAALAAGADAERLAETVVVLRDEVQVLVVVVHRVVGRPGERVAAAPHQQLALRVGEYRSLLVDGGL